MLLREVYWPRCIRDVKNNVQTCEACQRIEKSHETQKAPIKLVPIITESFRRLVVDVVGALPTTRSGYNSILTMLCPARKFAEAIPMRGVNSIEVVEALLLVFSRVGFPAELKTREVFLKVLLLVLSSRNVALISYTVP